jgi:hypothetical protein
MKMLGRVGDDGHFDERGSRVVLELLDLRADRDGKSCRLVISRAEPEALARELLANT